MLVKGYRQDAFRQIPIAPQDCGLLGFRWKDSYWADCFSPLRPAYLTLYLRHFLVSALRKARASLAPVARQILVALKLTPSLWKQGPLARIYRKLQSSFSMHVRNGNSAYPSYSHISASFHSAVKLFPLAAASCGECRMLPATTRTQIPAPNRGF
jgi:hypothetical protein